MTQINFGISLIVKLIKIKFQIKLFLKKLKSITNRDCESITEHFISVYESSFLNKINDNGQWGYFKFLSITEENVGMQ